MEQEQAKRQAGRVNGVPNVAYDLMVVPTNKLEGIVALEEYKLEADAAHDPELRRTLERIEHQEREAVDELRALLVTRLLPLEVQLT